MTKLSIPSIFQLLRRRPAFRRLWVAEIISYLGDWLTYVAVSLLALAHGDGLLAVALVLVAHSLPRAVAAPLAGLWADRFDRKKVLVASELTQGLLAAAMAGAAWASDLALLQGLLVIRTATGAVFATAQTAAVPRTVHEDELMLANALTAATWSTMFAVGVAFGGLLASAVSPATVIAIDAATFLLGATLLMGLPAMSPRARPSTSRLLPAMKVAISHASRDLKLLQALLGKMPVALAGGGGWVYINHLAGSEAAMVSGALGLGLMHALRATGSGVGPLVLGRLGAGRLADRHVIAASYLGMFGSLATLTATSHPILAGAALLGWGASLGVNWVVTTAGIQRRGPDEILGRLSALDSLGMSLAQCTGALLAAVVVDAGAAPKYAVVVPLVAAVLLANALMAVVHDRRREGGPLTWRTEVTPDARRGTERPGAASLDTPGSGSPTPRTSPARPWSARRPTRASNS